MSIEVSELMAILIKSLIMFGVFCIIIAAASRNSKESRVLWFFSSAAICAQLIADLLKAYGVT